ncbi:MAG TPA: MFS transporter [Gaiellaceae bacterium]|nr:MFS transporter [Gaiellaceae bacterium]
MTLLRRAGRVTFAALAVPNFRLYYGGQAISLIGTWMQMIAQGWLVLELTNSSIDLGLLIALQTVPVLLLGPYGGVVADRIDKRRLMIVLQSAMGVQALVLGILTVTHAIRFWEIGVLAVLLGLNNAFENPARQSFMMEMVGPKELRNAVSLNSTLVNAARTVGPAAAGILIATVGTGVCFLINAVSFIPVVLSLTRMDLSQLHTSERAVRAKGQLREGLRYVRHAPELAIPLVMMGFVGMLAYEFPVSLPVLDHRVLHGGSTGYGFMTAAMGIGAVVGGLFTAARGRTGLKPLVVASFAFGALILLASVAPTMTLELPALALVGAASVSFMAIGNSTLQLRADPAMRGRVMALWFVAFQGSTPIGGPLIGWVIAWAGARVGLGIGGVTCLVVAVLGLAAIRHLRRPELADELDVEDAALAA